MVKDAGWEAQLVSLLEDAGLVKIIDGPSDFQTGMFNHAFILPDWVINIVVVFTVAYWLLKSGGMI